MFFDRTGAMWRRMKKAFDGFEKDLTVVSVSPWLMDRAKKSPILEKMSHCVIFNGLDVGVFHPYDTADLREKHHCKGKKVVFHATPSFSADPSHLKGGYYVLELVKKMPEVQFIVAGKCTGSFEVPQNVTLLGQVTDQTLLARYYSMADATVIASKRETFSMIVAESLCCGTPVVGFEAGAPEQIAIPEYSTFVSAGDCDALWEALKDRLAKDKNQAEIGKIAHRVYDKNGMLESYIKLYREKII